MYFKTALVILKIFLRHPSSIYDFAQTYAKDVNGNLLKFLNHFFLFEKDKEIYRFCRVGIWSSWAL